MFEATSDSPCPRRSLGIDMLHYDAMLQDEQIKLILLYKNDSRILSIFQIYRER